MEIKILNVKTKKDWKLFSAVHPAIIMVVLYLSFVFTCMYESRSTYILMLSMGLSQIPDNAGWLVASFFLGGLAYYGVFELLIHFISATATGGTLVYSNTASAAESKRFKHILRFFFIAINIINGCLNLICFYEPLFYNFNTLVLSFIITTAFCVLFFLYYAYIHLPKFLYGRVLKSLSSMYFMIWLLRAVLFFAGGAI